ncbi:unnamed protein product [Fructobacillus cardui]|nr:XkdX family protein [Fructobacillus cardui]MCK8627192.1 XkdX family protein [Fructobacillus cardui]CAK1230045.1 unnamed protein product [Fructobacillus cardui]
MFDFVKAMYPNYWSKEDVQMAVTTKWVTQEQADSIVSGENGD